MKHKISLSVVLSLFLVGGTFCAPVKKGGSTAGAKVPAVSVGGALDLMIKAKKGSKNDREDAFKKMYGAFFESFRPVGSKAADFGSHKGIFGLALDRAEKEAKVVGYSKAEIEEFVKNANDMLSKAPSNPTKKPAPKGLSDQKEVDGIIQDFADLKDLISKKPAQQDFDDFKKKLSDRIDAYAAKYSIEPADRKFVADKKADLLKPDYSYTAAGGGVNADNIAKALFGGQDVKNTPALVIQGSLDIGGALDKKIGDVFAVLEDAAGQKGVNINIDPKDVDKTKATALQKQEIAELLAVLTALKADGNYKGMPQPYKDSFDTKLQEVTTIHNIIK